MCVARLIDLFNDGVAANDLFACRGKCRLGRRRRSSVAVAVVVVVIVVWLQFKERRKGNYYIFITIIW